MIIYKALNTATGKCYIGQTVGTLKSRITKHFRDSSKDRYKNYPFYRSSAKHGWEVFTWSTVAIATCRQELNNLEIIYIEQLNTIAPNGYNANGGGNTGRLPGFKHSAETIEKIRLGNLGRNSKKQPQEYIDKRALANRKPREIRRCLDCYIKKEVISCSSTWIRCLKCSKIKTARAIGLKNKGKKRSAESRFKMRVAKLKTKWSLLHAKSGSTF